MAEKNSAIYRGSKKAGLDHWVGPTQHVGDGVSSSHRAKKQPKAGTVKDVRHGQDDSGNGD